MDQLSLFLDTIQREPQQAEADDLSNRLHTRRPIAVDLFAGIGGFSLGFEQAGFDVVASVEYDPVHAAVHAYNFPLTQVLCADISELSVKDLRQAVEQGYVLHGGNWQTWDGQIDVVFGGPPCQGFSNIGKRLIDDTRNQLVFHFFRVIAELRPRYFVMENVPGMASGGHSSILESLIAEFELAGYQMITPPRVLNAANFGVPQDRRRLILVGARKGERLPHYPFPTVRPAPKRAVIAAINQIQDKMFVDSDLPLGPTVWDAVGDLPDLDRFQELSLADSVWLHTDELQAIEQRSSAYARTLRGLIPDANDWSYPRTWNRQFLTSSLRTEHTELSIRRFAATTPGQTEPVSRFYRLDPAGLSNTLRAGTGSEHGAYTSPRPIHPVLPRVISVREAARLHSFPDWFRLHSTKWHGFRQIGNSVPPLLGRAIAAEIAKALEIEPTVPQKSIELGRENLLYLNMSEAAAHFGARRESIPQPRRRVANQVKEVSK